MFVLPGTDITDFIDSRLTSAATAQQQQQQQQPETDPPRIRVGPGIIQTDSGVLTLRAGLLSSSGASRGCPKFTLSSAQASHARYIPAQNDLVIGIVTARLAELFRVDIGGPLPATLPLLTGFEGATRRTRPSWNVGTVIFARVSAAHPDLEPELACFDPSGNIPVDVFGELSVSASNSNANTQPNANANATTNESAASSNNNNNNTPAAPCLSYCQLLRTSCAFSRSLQSPQSIPLLQKLGSRWTFEIAAGANGRVFVAGRSAAEVSHICRVLLKEIELDFEE